MFEPGGEETNMIKIFRHMLFLGALTALLIGCSSNAEVTVTTDKSETETEDIKAEAGSPVNMIAEVSELIGLKDEDTEDLLGGGEENWSEDKEFYIGRIYSVDIDGETYMVYTTCDDEKIVESVSIWIVNGERDVTDEEAQEWKDRVTEFMGAEPMEDPEISEGGSKNSHWRANGLAASMHQMKDILTISLQPAVGELK